MPIYTLDWQRGPLTIEVPDRNLQTRIEAPALPILGTPVELVARALDRPIGCPPLEEMVRPGDRVAILVTDYHDHLFGQEGVGDLILDRLNARGGPGLYGCQGGGGIVLPGSAGADTIRRNHSMIMTTRTASAWGPGNPQRIDVLDAADLAKLRLKIDFTANAVFAGYPREEWP